MTIDRGIRSAVRPRPTRIFHLAWSILLLAAPARAQPAEVLRIDASGSCPSGAEVAQEVQRLLPTADVASVNASAQQPNDAVLTEDPTGLVVSLRGQSRRFDDPAQRCAERARLAAVFVAVVLDPPRFALPPPPPPPSPAPTVVAQPPRPAAPTAHRTLEIELGPSSQVAAASGTENVPFTVGGSLRVLYGRGFALTAGVQPQTATTLHFGTADVHGWWIPVDVGARVAQIGRRWDTALELSLLVAPARLSGQGAVVAPPGEASWRVEAGARIGAVVRYWPTRRVGVFLSPHASWFPRPYNLSVADLGVVGETPKLWLGIQLGAAFRLR